MPPDPTGTSILGRQPSAHQQLWHRLAPGSWPLPFALLPGGTALVGGAVRDGLLGRLGKRPDLDLVVPEDAIALAHRLADHLGGTAVELDRDRSIGRLIVKGWTIDLARQAGDTLMADLALRDYTINAMALRLPLQGEALALVDPLNGLDDLATGQLRAIAEANLLSDPLRLLRGLRLAAELEFTLTTESWRWILRHRSAIGSVAGERVLAELLRLVSCPAGALGVDLLLESDLLKAFPPVRGSSPAGRTAHLTMEQAQLRGLTTAETLEALPIARLSALLQQETLQALHASHRLRRRCRLLSRWRNRLVVEGTPSPRDLGALPEAEQLELHRQMEADWPALALELDPPAARAALQRWRDPGDPLFHPRAPLDGGQLQQRLGLPPGRRLGLLLEHLTAERAFGRLPREDPTGQECLMVARLWLETTAGPCHD